MYIKYKSFFLCYFFLAFKTCLRKRRCKKESMNKSLILNDSTSLVRLKNFASSTRSGVVQVFPLRDRRRRCHRYKRRLCRPTFSFRSFAPGHRYLEDAPVAASLSDSSKIVFQTDRKAGGHRRVRECGGGERTMGEGKRRILGLQDTSQG